MPTAFVLSGGASLGAAQAGMLQALYERGIRPDFLVGTSAGALNAAFAAFRPPTEDTALELQEIWRQVRRSDVFPPNPLAAGLGMLGLRDHSVSARSLRRLVKRYVDADWIEEAHVPLHIVTADVLTGEEVLLSSGPVVEALLASASIPGVFPAVEWEGRLLCDGGVVNNCPISHAVELGATHVIVLPAMGPQRLSEPPRGAFAAGVQAVSRAVARRAQHDIELYRLSVDLTVLPSPSLEGMLPTDFSRAEELIQHAIWGARRALRRATRPRVQLRRVA
jgi:NTE family protein